MIERYTKNTRFCLICNYVNKIIPALQSRCMRFRFAPLAVSQMRGRLQEIITMENVTATPAALDRCICYVPLTFCANPAHNLTCSPSVYFIMVFF